jgi:hypothetical protein
LTTELVRKIWTCMTYNSCHRVLLINTYETRLFIYLFILVLVFELRTSHLVSRHSITVLGIKWLWYYSKFSNFHCFTRYEIQYSSFCLWLIKSFSSVSNKNYTLYFTN